MGRWKGLGCRDTAPAVSADMAGGAALRLTDTESGYSVVYEADDNFKYWMVFNGGNKDFLCVEPQTWINCAPHAPAKMGDVNIIGIKAGEKREFVTTMKVEK